MSVQITSASSNVSYLLAKAIASDKANKTSVTDLPLASPVQNQTANGNDPKATNNTDGFHRSLNVKYAFSPIIKTDLLAVNFFVDNRNNGAAASACSADSGKN